MRKIAFITAILLSVSVLSAQSLNLHDMDPFTAVDLNFIGKVVIKQSTTIHEVTIEASDYKFIKSTHVEVVKGKLFIYMDKNLPRGKTDIRMEIKVPRLEELSIHSSEDVTVEKRNEPQLTIINMGAGDCALQCLKIEETLELHNKGAGSIKVKSPDPIRQQTLLIDNTGAGDVSILGSHVSNSLIVNNKGAGDVSVNLMSIPTEELILQNQGASNITVQNISANRMVLRNQGAGDMKLMNGQAEEMTLESIGAGNAHLLLKVTTAHISHAGVGNIIATVTGTAYLTNKSELGKVTIHGGGKIVRE